MTEAIKPSTLALTAACGVTLLVTAYAQASLPAVGPEGESSGFVVTATQGSRRR